MAHAYDVRFGVKSGHSERKTRCPLYPRKRTFAVQLEIGFGPIADINFNGLTDQFSRRTFFRGDDQELPHHGRARLAANGYRRSLSGLR
jgi:hypothetical protein